MSHAAPYKLGLSPATLTSAEEPARSIMLETQAKLGMVPNMYAGMANAPALLQTYVEAYNRFRGDSGFTPAEQEVVFLTISRENGCDYCVAAHSFLADRMSRVPAAVTDAIRNGDPVPDVRLAALHNLTAALVRTRGRPDADVVAPFLAAGYTEVQILFLLLALSAKTISNYSNHMFETPLDPMFASRAV